MSKRNSTQNLILKAAAVLGGMLFWLLIDVQFGAGRRFTPESTAYAGYQFLYCVCCLLVAWCWVTKQKISDIGDAAAVTVATLLGPFFLSGFLVLRLGSRLKLYP